MEAALTGIPNDQPNVLLLCKCNRSCNIVGLGDIDGIADIVAQLAWRLGGRPRVTTLVGKEGGHYTRTRVHAGSLIRHFEPPGFVSLRLNDLLDSRVRPLLLQVRTLLRVIHRIVTRRAKGYSGNQTAVNRSVESRPFCYTWPALITWEAFAVDSS